MRNLTVVFAALFACFSTALAQGAGPAKPALPELEIKYRWVFTMTNLASEDALQKTIDLMKRRQAGGLQRDLRGRQQVRQVPASGQALRQQRPQASPGLHRAGRCN